MGASAGISVLEPGLLTTVQDLGRPGMARNGVSPGGAVDRAALILGNRLVGNDPGEAGLEISLVGPRLAFSGRAVVALTGADLGATLDGTPAPRWEPFLITDGTELHFSPSGAAARGARAYLCVAGGLAVEPVLGSRSTDLFGGFGGVEGRPLRAGDDLSLREPPTDVDALLRRRLAEGPPTYPSELTARVVLGPQQDRFTAEGLATFLGDAYTVSPRGDRTGLRLTGPAIAHTAGADLISEGIAHGAIQVPGDGQPIVLLAARQTVGGYPKIATVIGADLGALGQVRPGNQIHFTEVSVAEARARTLEERARLDATVIVETGSPVAGWTAPMGEASRERGEVEAWTPAGVARLLEAVRGAGIDAFRLEIETAGFRLKLEVGDRSEIRATPQATLATNDPGVVDLSGDVGDEIVVAPLLGVFYRRSAPDRPPVVEVGQRVTAGQALGLIEVMKTYHDVTAPRDGTVAAILVDDGQFVEYGQPIARLTPDTIGNS